MKDAPWRFGIEHEVAWDMTNSGVWTEEEGFRVWRLGVRAEGATSLSFYLSRFVVPKGGELFVWNAERTHYLGAFNHLNVKDWEGLALSLIEGDRVVIEYREPLAIPALGDRGIAGGAGLPLSPASRGRTHGKNASYGPFGNSGACNINVNCPEGDDWQVENQSVALIVNGGFAACSGALVNNTANDGTPYFLTANHCLGTPNTWTYYFNHESSTCSGSTGPTNNSISEEPFGQQWRFRRGPHSIGFHLLSLGTWNTLGWDASNAAHSSSSRHSPPFWRREEDLL